MIIERFRRCVAICYASNGERDGLIIAKLDANVSTYLSELDTGAKAAIIFFS